MSKSPILHPGDNARIDIQRDADGGVLVVIKEAKGVKAVHLSPENAIGVAICILEAAGIPISEAYARRAQMGRA